MDKIGGMPVDWANSTGWEEYYSARKFKSDFHNSADDLGSIPITAYVQLANDLLANDDKNVWLPGCGFSPIPKLLSQLGLNVYATDVSPTAVQFQTSADNQITKLTKELTDKLKPDGQLIASVQDFHQPYQSDFFDLIINIRAFQGFPWRSMCRIASVHYQALKPGRLAYFDTMNVQGEKRERLAAALIEAGFVIGNETTQRLMADIKQAIICNGR